MDTTKVTVKQIIDFLNASNNYVKEHQKEKSKLTYMLAKQGKKYSEKIKPILDELNNADIPALRHRAASTDEQGNLIERPTDFKTGEKGQESTSLRYAYKPEKLITLEKEVAVLTKKTENQEIEISTPYKEAPFYVEIPKKFDFKYLESFKKFIFNPEISDDEEERIFLEQEIKEKTTVESVLNGR